MNFLKMDGPVMNFLRTITNFLILQLLFLLCCIPIITIGAALSAKYHVAMKLVKDEGEGVVKSFFAAFKSNFKDATPVWITQLIIYILIYIDWAWMLEQGIRLIPIPYLIAMIVITCVANFVGMVIFPMISRFEMTKTKLYKGTVTFVFTHFFQLLGIFLLNLAAIVACIWYIQWLPLIAAVAVVAVTFFLATTLNKEFDKVEQKYREEHPEEFEQDEEEGFKFRGEREEESYSALDSSYAASRKELGELAKTSAIMDAEPKEKKPVDGKKKNKVTAYYEEERSKLKEMTGKQKWQYFVDYYLAMVIVTLLLIGGLAWYIRDVVKDKLNVFTGGLVNCTMTEEGHEYATQGFLDWAEYSKSHTATVGSTTMSFDSAEEYYNGMMNMAVNAEVTAGVYNFFLMDEESMQIYKNEEIFTPLEDLGDISMIPKEYLVYDDSNMAIAVELDEEHKEKLGFPKNAEIYLGFIFSSDITVNAKYFEYLYH